MSVPAQARSGLAFRSPRSALSFNCLSRGGKGACTLLAALSEDESAARCAEGVRETAEAAPALSEASRQQWRFMSGFRCSAFAKGSAVLDKGDDNGPRARGRPISCV